MLKIRSNKVGGEGGGKEGSWGVGVEGEEESKLSLIISEPPTWLLVFQYNTHRFSVFLYII